MSLEQPKPLEQPGENLWGAALQAQEWFYEEVKKRGLSLPKEFPGMKNLILQLTFTEKHRGLTPKEIAEKYLEKLEKKQKK